MATDDIRAREQMEVQRYYQNVSLQLRLHGAMELGRKYVIVRLARMLANGALDFPETERLLGKVTDVHSWYPAFAAAGAQAEQLGDAAAGRGLRVSAADHYRRASALWHWSAHLARRGSADMETARRQRVDLYQRAAAYMDPPVTRLEIPYAGKLLPGYLHMPRGVERPPVVIMVDGADSVKEEYHNWAQEFVRRGCAVVTFDGPGQGESQSRGIWMVPLEYHKAVTAVVDGLEQRSDVDAGRVGAWGSSMGGFLVSVAAAHEHRLKAVVCLGGFYDFRDFPFWYVSIQLNVQEALNLPTLAETRRYVADHCNLQGLNSRIRAPYLVIHGARDELLTTEEARQMAADAPLGQFELFDDGFHTCTNHNLTLTPLMCDWLTERL